MTEPPTPVVIRRAIRCANVHVPVFGTEGHVILIGQSVSSISRKSRDPKFVARFFRADVEVVVVSAPVSPVDVHQVDFQASAVVAGESVKGLVAGPEFVDRRAKTCNCNYS